MMKLRILTLTSAVGALLVFGCANSENDGPIDQPAEPAEQTQQLDQAETNKKQARKHKAWRHHGKRHRGKRGHFLRTALKHVELSAEQQTKIEGLIANLDKDRDKKHEQFRAERSEHKKKMIAAIRGGNVAELTPPTINRDQHIADKVAQMETSLNELHSILNAEQRQTLVQAMRDKFEKKAKWKQRFFAGDTDDNVDGAWKIDSVEPKRGRRGKHRRGKFGMQRLIEDLELTQAQQSQLEAARQRAGLQRPDKAQMRQRFAEHKKHMDAMLSAFEKADFNAKNLDLAAKFKKHGGKFHARKAEQLKVLVPILTPEQRGKLADRMERRFNRRGRR